MVRGDTAGHRQPGIAGVRTKGCAGGWVGAPICRSGSIWTSETLPAAPEPRAQRNTVESAPPLHRVTVPIMRRSCLPAPTLVIQARAMRHGAAPQPAVARAGRGEPADRGSTPERLLHEIEKILLDSASLRRIRAAAGEQENQLRPTLGRTQDTLHWFVLDGCFKLENGPVAPLGQRGAASTRLMLTMPTKHHEEGKRACSSSSGAVQKVDMEGSRPKSHARCAACPRAWQGK